MWRGLLVIVTLLGGACGAEGTSNQTFETRATIEYQALEGGWWYLRTDTGETYTPVSGLPSEFMVAGMKAQATLVLRQEVASYLPGPFVEISRIEQLAGF